MADKKGKYTSEVWNYFQIVENGERTKCNLCDVTLSYKSNSTKSMWEHLKSKHYSAISDEKKSSLKQAKLSFGATQKFSREKHEICYKAAAEVRFCFIRK